MPDAKLLWLGAGELEEPVRELAKKLEIEDKCLFMGSVGDVENGILQWTYFFFLLKWRG